MAIRQIIYEREANIGEVQAWFGDANGSVLKYNPTTNEYEMFEAGANKWFELRPGDVIRTKDNVSFDVERAHQTQDGK